ncbi:conserved hypothetical protein [Desulfamplus magnetovallimortis]|uniref:STAS domain-containing protein n=1 Tax=Desulfamplus magnetovallimortis TaxID=1246637 RepID=A0A1W1H6M2_9BACT|nr:hypothetical protein [Desulfamplus magnetovallimortis]SLM28076.1 conserved hypothetical protein [Desulfamplus magnetovallimortis]
MNIQGNTYEVSFDGKGTLVISGKLAAMPEEYEKMELFFEKVLDTFVNDWAEGATKELLLDLRALTFLNSSGIKTICVSLVMEADDVEGLHLRILCSESVTWQVETVPTFRDLMENLDIVFE